MKGKNKIFAYCKRCKRRIVIPLEETFKIEAPDGLFVYVHIHGKTRAEAHGLIIEVDRNVNIRNIRVTDQLVFALDEEGPE